MHTNYKYFAAFLFSYYLAAFSIFLYFLTKKITLIFGNTQKKAEDLSSLLKGTVSSPLLCSAELCITMPLELDEGIVVQSSAEHNIGVETLPFNNDGKSSALVRKLNRFPYFKMPLLRH